MPKEYIGPARLQQYHEHNKTALNAKANQTDLAELQENLSSLIQLQNAGESSGTEKAVFLVYESIADSDETKGRYIAKTLFVPTKSTDLTDSGDLIRTNDLAKPEDIDNLFIIKS